MLYFFLGIGFIFKGFCDGIVQGNFLVILEGSYSTALTSFKIS